PWTFCSRMGKSFRIFSTLSGFLGFPTPENLWPDWRLGCKFLFGVLVFTIFPPSIPPPYDARASEGRGRKHGPPFPRRRRRPRSFWLHPCRSPVTGDKKGPPRPIDPSPIRGNISRHRHRSVAEVSHRS